MNRYHSFILLILITFIYSKDYCDSTKITQPPTKAEDCNKGNHDGGYCCFIKGRSTNYCQEFGPNEYKYISDQVKYGKKCTRTTDGDDCDKFDDFSIDCKSSYLVFSTLMIILLFL